MKETTMTISCCMNPYLHCTFVGISSFPPNFSKTLLFKPSFTQPISSNHNYHHQMASKNQKVVVFEDFFPSMVEKLGAQGFLNELCNGFRLLMDTDKKMITFESLRKSSAVLGLQEMSDDDLLSMLREGDLDGDGCLNQMEFCVLMFRLSPDLMNVSRRWVEEVYME